MKKVLIISIALNLVGLLFFIGKRIYYNRPISQIKKADNDWPDKYNSMRTDVFNQLPVDSGDIVFIGNSITELFPVTEYFPNMKIRNRGIGGNRTAHVLNRIDSIAYCKPTKIFIEIGTNDLGNGVSVDSAIYNYQKIIARIKELSPLTTIYAESIPPVTYPYQYNDSIPMFNRRLQQLCIAENITFIDVYKSFVVNNMPDSTYTSDGIHPNAKGYSVYSNVLQEKLRN